VWKRPAGSVPIWRTPCPACADPGGRESAKGHSDEALSTYLSAHAKEKNDIWAAREVTLEPGKKYQLVNVAVWDSGVDLAIFRDRVLKNSEDQPSVLAYDIESRKTTGSLKPLNAHSRAAFAS